MLKADDLNNRSEALVRELLEAAGFAVEPIARVPGRRTADYVAQDARAIYLVEVTDRAPGHDFADFRRRLASIGHATLTRSPRRDRRFDDIVADKADQLRSTPVAADFRVLWVTALNPDADHIHEALLHTLYGTQLLWTVDVETYASDPIRAMREQQERACFYYHDAAFVGLEDVHAVAFSSAEKVCAFVNPFARDVDRFRASGFVDAFRSRRGLVDPRDGERRRDVLFMDLDADRSSPRTKWAALRAKYGLLVQAPTESEFTGGVLVRVPRPNDEPAR